jgi:subtilase family serine protease
MHGKKTVLLILFVLYFSLTCGAQTAQSEAVQHPLEVRPTDRLTGQIDEESRITLSGNRHPWAQPQYMIGKLSSDQPLEHMVLVLRPDPAQRMALEELIRAQHDPGSPYYHQWLTPEAFGEHFGISQSDLDQVVNWLEMHGMKVEETPASRRTVVFSGTAGQVESAFHTPIYRYLVNGETHFANATEPEIPQALAEVVHGVVSLHDFRSTPAHVTATPAFTNGYGAHFLAPQDWDTIYDVGPLYSQGLDGGGQSIAVVGRADITMSDVATFRSSYGLPANNPQVIINGADPGYPGTNDEIESTLDVEWAGAIAKKATVKYVASKSGASDGIVLSAQYVVAHNTAPIVTLSYILCEASLGSSGNLFWNGLWAQAASQGQSVFVASGDAGAAGCDNLSNPPATHGKAVNGMCSTPYSTCVGGTEFNDNYNPGAYWSATNGSGGASALSYIPELTWNESSSTGGLWSSGGGVSTVYTKPAWQVAPGVPNDGKRDVPDVSMAAAFHDAYIVWFQNQIKYLAGTSAAAPPLASAMALVLQNSGAPQGNINPVLYTLATQQLSGGRAAVFHDITGGNNSVPGVSGFSAGAGYDMATGLGSVDVFQLVNQWSEARATGFDLMLSSPSLSVSQGSSNTVTLNLGLQGGFSSPVTLSASGAPTGVTVTFSSPTLSSVAPVTVTVAAAANALASNGLITITGTGGGLSRTVSVTLTVIAPTFTLTPSVTSASVAPGGSVPVTLTTAGANGFKSAIGLSVSGLAQGVTASFAPPSIASPGSGKSILTLSAASGAAPGVSSLIVKATGGGLTQIQTLSLTVLTPSFTLTSSATSTSVAAGGSVPVTLTTALLYGFKAAIGLSVSGVPKGVTASFTPTSIASPGSGTSALKLSVASGTAAGTCTLTVTATGGGVTKTQVLSLTY